MKENTCKKKGCEKLIPDGEKYCSYHKMMKAEHRGTIIKRTLSIIGLTLLTAATKGKIKPKL